MAPAKRGRPAFSPPRPGKSKSTSVSTATKGGEALNKNRKNAAVSKKRVSGATEKRAPSLANKRGKRSRPADDDEDEDEEDSDDDTPRNGRSALALVDMQAGVDDDDDDDDEEEDDEHSEETLDNDSKEDTRISHTRHQNSSAEPDMILAEITMTNEPSVAPIPEKLVHRLFAHHFEKGDKTKISIDARDLVSKYLEVFVREAIMRSAFEKDERLGGDGEGGGGFLEVEDLEKAAVQLCLDF